MAFWDTVLNSPEDAPQYGRRLIPTIIDDNATFQPDAVCFSFPRSEVIQHGFRDISWSIVWNLELFISTID
jgi:hypothetical protein